MKVLAFIISDDIRQEVGNKFSLMGIFNQSIELSIPGQAPNTGGVALRLGIMLRARLEENDPQPDSFSLELLFNQTSLARIVGQLTLEHREAPFNLLLTAPVVPIHGSGLLDFRLQVNAGEELIFDGPPGDSITVNVHHQS